MRSNRVALSLLLCLGSADAFAQGAFVRSDTNDPWGVTNDEGMLMDAIFGEGGWTDLRIEAVDPAALFGDAYTFIYLDGSDRTADALEAFLHVNGPAMAGWLARGNALFINAAPNEGDGMQTGLGDVRINYDRVTLSNRAEPVDLSHPIWAGVVDAAAGWGGNSAAHGTVSGSGLVSLLGDEDARSVLALRPGDGGCGLALLGGLTPARFWGDGAEPFAMRATLVGWLTEQIVDCDRDDDGVADALDNCPLDANADQADADLDGRGDACDFDDDLDADGVANAADNCPFHPNPDQADQDADGLGDPCDPVDDPAQGDLDGDGVINGDDNCPLVANADQADGDGDGQGDGCDGRDDRDLDADGVQNQDDNCPFSANPAQSDSDGDGVGDACDAAGAADGDADGIEDAADNCPGIANPDQVDSDADGRGDACDGRDADDLDGDGIPNAEDPCPFGSEEAADGGAGETCAQRGGGGGGGCGIRPAERGANGPWWVGLGLLCVGLRLRDRGRDRQRG